MAWTYLNWKMWSGLLPPGLNESDVDLSSDDGNEAHGSLSKEDANEDVERVRLPELQENGLETNAISEPVVISVTDGENKSQPCPSGVPLNMWNKFLELQEKNREMKTQAKQENKGRKRKRRRKEKQKKNEEVTKSSQQLVNEDKWKELTQYFGINDRFESPVDSRAPQKSGLELSIEKSVAEGDIDKAEELSDRLATRELGVKIAKAAACCNFVKAKQEAEAAQEAQKKKKLAWGFEAKKRWETKSNMGYM
ncbi:protein FAM204A isoform X1 [Falco cherrug]|uniref:protein FAM204A isoform X1 n=1 Tax=Falco cherrug TaxID=345164 RepID=UPI002479738C|nr:protein FAM204A isoform X1 [Falco cherrug]XP_055576435.1 protein FAM204A isoform X1 [Falco cherrug]